MISIKQNTKIATQLSVRASVRLPDFRNLGVCLRVLLLVNLLTLFTAIAQNNSWDAILPALAELSILIQPVLLLTLMVLYALNRPLHRLPYYPGNVAVTLIALALVLLVHRISSNALPLELPSALNCLLFSLTSCIFVLYYFNLRQRALSPAVAEARLQALQARIRPHFLFNSINAVISIVRSDPKRAETALMDMSDLFRVLMADNRDLVPLADELALCRQYLALEKLRLEERLHVHWQIDNMPPDALIPPLVLQPLLENAVYHGVEAMPESGEITIKIHSYADQVHIVMTNPCPAPSKNHNGNKMALKNIRERLALHFDAEAQLSSKVVNHEYIVEILIPYHHE